MENTEPVLAHKCGQCYGSFETEEAYLSHTCPETGVTPEHPASMGPNYEAIQQAALERGAASDIFPQEYSAGPDDKGRSRTVRFNSPEALDSFLSEDTPTKTEPEPERQPLNIVGDLSAVPESEEYPNQAAEISAPSSEVVADPEVVGTPDMPITSQVPAEPVETPESQEQPLPPMAPDLIIE